MSAPEPRPVLLESFIEEMKRYLHLLPEDAVSLRRLLESSGADGYLEKPVYDSALLVEKVRGLINAF